jgi:FKBP-type peptidyl-prolyl cis-trans isomerase FkpA
MLSGIMMMIFLASCNPNKKFDDYEAKEKLDIQNFLSRNDTLDFELKASGLYYLDYVLGTGPQAETHDTAYVFFAMYFLSGSLFDTNMGTTDTLIFPVNEGKFIPGFEEGITYMREGGTAVFLLPSSLAFGSEGTYYIMPYTPFICETELVKLVKP